MHSLTTSSHTTFLHMVIFFLFLLSISEACITMELTKCVYKHYSRFCKERVPCLVFKEGGKAADTGEKWNKYMVRVIHLQNLCQFVLLLLKGLDGRKSAKEKGKEGFGGMWPTNSVQRGTAESRFITGWVFSGVHITIFSDPSSWIFPAVP